MVAAEALFSQNITQQCPDQLLHFFLSSGNILQEGHAIESEPPGFYLKQNHGQLIVREGKPTGLENSTKTLWQTQPFVDDNVSSINSFVDFQEKDCNLYIDSETMLKPDPKLGDRVGSYVWKSFYSDSPIPDGRPCFLAWSSCEEKLAIGNEDALFYIDSWKRRHIDFSDFIYQDAVLLIDSQQPLNIIQGFMVESNPPGYFLRQDDGQLQLYHGLPTEANSSLLWKMDDPYVYDGDSLLTWSALSHDCNLVLFAPSFQFLWKTRSEIQEESQIKSGCFLAWIPSEERLALYTIINDSPYEEIWTSKNFHWEPINPERDLWEQLTVTVLTRLSSTLSMIGSGLIIGIIASRWLKHKRIAMTRDRLLFTMSCLDFLSSLAHNFDVAAIPRGTYNVRGAIGTQASCSTQGFFIQLGFAVPLYNCMICLYSLLVVCFKLKENYIATRIEPYMHLIGLGFALLTSTLGIFLRLYNSNSSFCWVSAFPFDCDSESVIKCLRGGNAFLYQLLFAGSVLLLSFFVTTISMGYLYFYVRKHITDLQIQYYNGSSTLREVGKQAFLYTAAFVISFIWPVAYALQRKMNIPFPIWQNLLLSFFLPLQGFWNFFIFMRPMCYRLKRQNKDKSFFWVLRTSIVREATLSYPTNRYGADYRRIRNLGLNRSQSNFFFSLRRWSNPLYLIHRSTQDNDGDDKGSELSMISTKKGNKAKNKAENSFDEVSSDEPRFAPISEILRNQSEEVMVSELSYESVRFYVDGIGTDDEPLGQKYAPENQSMIEVSDGDASCDKNVSKELQKLW